MKTIIERTLERVPPPPSASEDFKEALIQIKTFATVGLAACIGFPLLIYIAVNFGGWILSDIASQISPPQ